MHTISEDMISNWIIIKRSYPAPILLIRYNELYFSLNTDAFRLSEITGIRQVSGKGEEPLLTMTVSELDKWLGKIVKAGYQVAVCDEFSKY